jgi:hypothetical protein
LVQTFWLHLVLVFWLPASSTAVPCCSSLAVACLVSAQSSCNWKACTAIPLVAFASNCHRFEEVQEVACHQRTASLATSDYVPSFSWCCPATDTYCERWCMLNIKWGRHWGGVRSAVSGGRHWAGVHSAVNGRRLCGGVRSAVSGRRHWGGVNSAVSGGRLWGGVRSAVKGGDTEVVYVQQ